MALEEYLCWTVSHPGLPGEFARLVYEVCHVVVGLRPTGRADEGAVVRGWLAREQQWVSGAVWYLVSVRWWNQWRDYVDGAEEQTPAKQVKT